MQIGIVGLPNVGKSTLFNALTRAGANAENYPFCTIDKNVGVVSVPDERLELLHGMHPDKKKTPAIIEFVDIAGLVKGASKGEGLGNQFLGHIRSVDAITQVVRCFTDKNVSHVDGEVNPVRDIEIINTELIMADLELIERQMEKTERMLKSGDKEYQIKYDVLQCLKQNLEEGKNIRQMNLNTRELEPVRDLQLLTAKPMLYLANIDENMIGHDDNPLLQEVKAYAADEGCEVIPFSAKIEADIAELDSDEAELFLEELGFSESGLDRIIKASYNLLDLITFFTVAGGNEVRATTVEKGTKAPSAAGKIHSDMEKGFIRAEVIGFNDLYQAGSISNAREQGLLRLEGKDYVIQNGDVCYFRFNV